MKMLKLSLVVLVSMALPCFAGSPGPQAFGPMKFGMSREEADKALEKITEVSMRRMPPGDTVSSVRKDFVINGTKYPAKVTSRNKLPLSVSFRNDLETKNLAAVMVHKDVPDAAKYEEVKEAWEVLRDIAQSKFGAPKQGGGSGTFPTLAALQNSETIVPAKAPHPGTVAAHLDGITGEKKSIVTDVWETVDGVRVELSVDQRLPDLMVRVVLKATEMKK
jgi:hypothetical protein